ncbi:cyclic nucleotide-binding domain-containing protein [Acidovorax sp. Be4]|uniref:Cyclic nucleotide-binding domain-containing protein n=1 Tax=Acidovorax bellezanensis TaxID=2976702 RepID=A0ABT2PKP4_9BURK|nr:cyclic nucleotide-binding domain-containing protein [Acidovorax sp. Be4]MCT9810800.1 cyclic nucleotide-binding domain-containing protein [Acidovorax sp. Be4]
MPSSTFRSSLALRQIPLFEGLDHACLERIAAACEWRHVDAKTPVFARSSTGNDVFFLLTGRVRITSYSAHGREVSFRDYLQGEHFGDLSAMDGQIRSADVLALESSQLASLTGERFMQPMANESLVANTRP